MIIVEEKKYYLYVLFSIAAILITLLAFILLYSVVNNSENSFKVSQIKSRLADIDKSYSVELVNNELLKEDFTNYTNFYNAVRTDFDNLIKDADTSDSLVKDLKDQIDSAETENSDLLIELKSLEAQIK